MHCLSTPNDNDLHLVQVRALNANGPKGNSPHRNYFRSDSGTSDMCNQDEFSHIVVGQLARARSLAQPGAGLRGLGSDTFAQIFLGSRQSTHVLFELLLVQTFKVPLAFRGKR